jgi:hypothetical protein
MDITYLITKMVEKNKIKKILCFIIHICFYNLDLN